MESCLKIAELEGIPAAVDGSNFIFSPLSLVAAGAALLLRLPRTRPSPLCLRPAFPSHPRRRPRNQPLVCQRGMGGAIHGGRSVFLVCRRLHLRRSCRARRFQVSVDSSTRMILANALYFKGKWQEKFDRFMTENGKFHLLNGNSIRVPFMSSIKEQFISSYNGFKVLKLPYKMEEDSQENRRSFSMLIFLPDERDGLHDLIRRAVSHPNFIEEHVPHSRVDVNLFMVPKFKMSFDLEATDALKHLGLESIFDPSTADLNGICLYPSEQLYVSNIYHKAAIEVDEDGTEAVAATMAVVTNGLPLGVNFVADHPFIFVVREEETGAILFFGHVVNPSIKA